MPGWWFLFGSGLHQQRSYIEATALLSAANSHQSWPAQTTLYGQSWPNRCPSLQATKSSSNNSPTSSYTAHYRSCSHISMFVFQGLDQQDPEIQIDIARPLLPGSGQPHGRATLVNSPNQHKATPVSQGVHHCAASCSGRSRRDWPVACMSFRKRLFHQWSGCKTHPCLSPSEALT